MFKECYPRSRLYGNRTNRSSYNDHIEIDGSEVDARGAVEGRGEPGLEDRAAGGVRARLERREDPPAREALRDCFERRANRRRMVREVVDHCDARRLADDLLAPRDAAERAQPASDFVRAYAELAQQHIDTEGVRDIHPAADWQMHLAGHRLAVARNRKVRAAANRAEGESTR